jgi:AraC family transcriptional regulator
MKVETKEMPELRVVTVRHIGSYQGISEAFERLGTIATAAGLSQDMGAVLMAIYHDDIEKTPPDQLRSDAAVTVAEGMPIPAGLGELRISAGRYATTTHVGPYQTLGEAWARLKRDARTRGGPSYEIYRNTPAQVPPDKLVTELYLPIA